jgi:hypothetical protein
MSVSEDRLSILRMIEDHQITAEEGAQWLATGSRPQPVPDPAPAPVAVSSTPSPKTGKGRYLRVLVTDKASGKIRTSVTVPVTLVKWGLQFAPNVQVNNSSINLDELSEILTAEDGKIVEVDDEEDGEHVLVYIE